MNTRFTKKKYRQKISSDLISFFVKIDSSDLFILAERDLSSEITNELKKLREVIKNHIKLYPEFMTSLDPLLQRGDCPEIIESMYRAGKIANVGPMAAVAGAIAESLGNKFMKISQNLIIENGGDTFISSDKDRIIQIFSGNIYFKDKVGLKISNKITPCGVCTSSGKIGHSLSFGNADVVTIISKDVALADAVATAICNIIQKEEDIENAVNKAMEIKGILGALAIYGDKLAVAGNIELTSL